MDAWAVTSFSSFCPISARTPRSTSSRRLGVRRQIRCLSSTARCWPSRSVLGWRYCAIPADLPVDRGVGGGVGRRRGRICPYPAPNRGHAHRRLLPGGDDRMAAELPYRCLPDFPDPRSVPGTIVARRSTVAVHECVGRITAWTAFLKPLAESFARCAIPGRYTGVANPLIVEITERALPRDTKRAMIVLQPLLAIGVWWRSTSLAAATRRFCISRDRPCRWSRSR